MVLQLVTSEVLLNISEELNELIVYGSIIIIKGFTRIVVL